MPQIFDQKHDWIGVLLSKEPKNHICLPFIQHHLLDNFWISQKARWSIVYMIVHCRFFRTRVASSVTRRLYYFTDIWPFTTIKLAKYQKKFAKIG